MSNYAKRKEAEALERKESAKKTLLIVLAVVVVAGIVIAGGFYLRNRSTGNDNTVVATGDPNYDIMDYVTLGNYEGLDVYYVTPSVSDEDLQNEMDGCLEAAVEYSDIEDRGVQSGDKVTIDFTGTMDGEEFSGGSAEDYEYVLGEGAMIEGFDEGIYGLKVDESATLNLTFPEDYKNEEYAGKDVEFKITVKGAQEITYQPEWDDEFAKKNTDGECQTADEYKEKLRTQLLNEATQDSDDQLMTDIMDAIMENTNFNGYPEYLYNTVSLRVEQNIQSICSMYGFSESDYLTYFAGGRTKDDIIMENVKSQMLTEALIKTIGVELSDEEYKERATADLEDYGVSSIKEFEETYTKDAIVEYYTSLKLQDILKEKANITDVSKEKYDKLTATEEE